MTSAQVFVQMFDVTLEAYFGRHLLCIHAPTCGYGPALEYNGDVYSCDHFVEPRYKLGNIHETHLVKLVASPEQRKFGDDKRDTLTPQCQRCEVRTLCNGGLPEGSIYTLERRRSGPELPLRRPRSADCICANTLRRTFASRISFGFQTLAPVLNSAAIQAPA